jgi:hypothetical protein
VTIDKEILGYQYITENRTFESFLDQEESNKKIERFESGGHETDMHPRDDSDSRVAITKDCASRGSKKNST